MSINFVCFDENDSQVLERFEWYPRWVATLCDNRVVYDDSNRFGPSDNAWLRLSRFCRENNLWLNSLTLQFRQNQCIWPNQGTYHLTLGAGAAWGSLETKADSYFVLSIPHPLGYVVPHLSESYRTLWYKCPELSVWKDVDSSKEEIENGDLKEALIKR